MGNFIAAVHGVRQVLVGRIVTMDGNVTIASLTNISVFLISAQRKASFWSTKS